VAFQQEAQGVQDVRLVIGDEDSRLRGFDFHGVLKRDRFHRNILYFQAPLAVIPALLVDVRSRTSSGA
jgi:hypothetical protein